MPYGAPEPDRTGSIRQGQLAVVFLLAALAMSYVPDSAQESISRALQATLLRPFISTQHRLADSRLRAFQVDELRTQLDSATATLSTHAALMDENRALRDLLDLSQRVGPSFKPATALRPGTTGSESVFLVDVGSEDGVREGAAVVSRHGLVGAIRDVGRRTSVAMDWTHPDFRVSAMLVDGTTYGMVLARRGRFREDDRLVLNGTAYHERAEPGTPVLTSGLGGVFPRGIPVGRIDGISDVQGQWHKSYWLRPMVEPGSVTHVLVAVEGAPTDVSEAWPADSIQTRDEAIEAEGRR